MIIKDEKLDFWIQHNQNVLLIGKHGTGKTAMIQSAFDRNKLNWKYFSAPTMDPWVDFIGVPKERTDNDGRVYLDLIRPKEFANDEVQALFFDELNRAKPKVLNAIMELIQFKSINGHKFNNLKMIWASINPEDEDDLSTNLSYMVETLDPAQKDRFHVIVESDDKPNRAYFNERYGNETAKTAIEWWAKLDDKTRDMVSPRRLQYALDMFTIGGDMKDVLPKQVNVGELANQLAHGSYDTILKKLMEVDDANAIRDKLKIENFYNGAIEVIKENKKFLEYFSDFLPPEKFNRLISSDTKFRNFVMKDKENIERFKDRLNEIIEVGAAKKTILTEIKEQMKVASTLSISPAAELRDTYYSETSNTLPTTPEREKATALITNIKLKGLSIEDLTMITAINCAISGSTYSKNWGSTDQIFTAIDKILKEEHNTTFKDFYNTIVVNDPMWIYRSSQNGAKVRVETRFPTKKYWK